MGTSQVKVEVRVFGTETARNMYGLGEVDGDELFANPKDYGVSKIVAVSDIRSLRHAVSGIPPERVAFAKIETPEDSNDETETEFTTDLDTAVAWFYVQ